jgi:hypothetical protein
LRFSDSNTIEKHLSAETIKWIEFILYETKKNNVDNISRTKAYFDFFIMYPEITWAFLASMVSRNGGWNMCDLEGEWFPKIIPKEKRALLFQTFECANWQIFQDAYPQMLLYHYSTKKDKAMFQLLPFFNVSSFMEREWNLFWNERNRKRLMTALIINEQNVIQKPVIEHPVYREKVFRTFFFSFQDWLHFSSVLLPTCNGELYGASVNGFKKKDNRIELGKRLANILFSPQLFPLFLEFSLNTEHTGSRFDYEQYLKIKKKRDTPFLRLTFPVVPHHIQSFEDWSKRGKIKRAWFNDYPPKKQVLLTDWYIEKQKQLHSYITLAELLHPK